MKFMELLRSRSRGLAFTLLVVGVLVVGPKPAAQSPSPITTPTGVVRQVIPLGAAKAAGGFGSEWRDRLLVRNPSTETLSGRIYVAPRNVPLDPPATPFLAYSLIPGKTQVVEGVWSAVHDIDGAGTLYIEGDQAMLPLVRAQMFNQRGEEEFGAQALAFDPSTDGYFQAGTTIGTVLSSAGYRDNPHLQSGPKGLSGRFVYTNGTNTDKTEILVTLGPNTTAQYNLTALLGSVPAAAGTLDLVIDNGEARAYLSRNNNATSDPAYDELEPIDSGKYAITVEIYVHDNGTPRQFAVTHPSEVVIKRVWQVNTLESVAGFSEYICNILPDPVVNSLPEVVSNYNTRLNPEQQQEFSGDRNGFSPFANDSNNNGLPCDDEEPDHQFVYLVRLNVAEK